ncbi:hypothetical protein GCM10009106_08380 [Sphingomonas japonica]
MIADFGCVVERIVDADTIICSGTALRIGAINARERDGSCRTGAVCPVMPPAQAKAIATKLLHRQTLRCEPVGKSWERVVARCTLPSGQDVGCALVASGAAAWEPVWARRYKLEACQ